MIPLFIFTLIIHTALSSAPCQDGVQIVSKETKNPGDLIGNWTYVYHWDSLNKFKREFVDDNVDHFKFCPEIAIEAIAPDYVKAKEAECSSSSPFPFKWSDAKLKLDAPLMKMKGGILFMGEQNWLMLECSKMVRVVAKKVSEDYIVMINPEMSHISEMIARKIPTLDELKCLAHNIDVGKDKDMSGFCLCY